MLVPDERSTSVEGFLLVENFHLPLFHYRILSPVFHCSVDSVTAVRDPTSVKCDDRYVARVSHITRSQAEHAVDHGHEIRFKKHGPRCTVPRYTRIIHCGHVFCL